jgi:hypothetical protein
VEEESHSSESDLSSFDLRDEQSSKSSVESESDIAKGSTGSGSPDKKTKELKNKAVSKKRKYAEFTDSQQND